MSLFQMAKDYINSQYPDEEARSQSASSWQGPFILPNKLSDYYQHFGPVDLRLGGSYSPFYLPCLDELWQYQAGYGYDPGSGILLEGWSHDWLAIGDDGYRPFIFSISSGKILFDPYSDGMWEPTVLFSSLEEMIQILCVVGSIIASADNDLRDHSLVIKRKYKEDAFLRVVEMTRSLEKAETILTLLSWY
ncbi:MAG: hypothetical protein JKY67_15355 [Pseudomonadales bacterium]|nr:hypothetical protein [Pseudomonadales bacterium]